MVKPLLKHEDSMALAVSQNVTKGENRALISNKLETKFRQTRVFIVSKLLENGGTLKISSTASLLKVVHLYNKLLLLRSNRIVKRGTNSDPSLKIPCFQIVFKM